MARTNTATVGQPVIAHELPDVFDGVQTGRQSVNTTAWSNFKGAGESRQPRPDV